MANSRGKDAAEIKPKFVPDYELQGRDDSGGPDFNPYTAQFDDGGHVTGGDKAHLSATGGKEAPKEGTEESDEGRVKYAKKAAGKA